MLVRAAQIEDFEGWQLLRRRLWPWVTDDETRAFLAQTLTSNSKTKIFIAQNENNQIIGFLEASLRTDYVEDCDTSPVGYIEGWFVDENYRRQHVGLNLTKVAEDWARRLGCQEMASDCDINNQTSLAAHLGSGYTEVGRNIHFKKLL